MFDFPSPSVRFLYKYFFFRPAPCLPWNFVNSPRAFKHSSQTNRINFYLDRLKFRLLYSALCTARRGEQTDRRIRGVDTRRLVFFLCFARYLFVPIVCLQCLSGPGSFSYFWLRCSFCVLRRFIVHTHLNGYRFWSQSWNYVTFIYAINGIPLIGS